MTILIPTRLILLTLATALISSAWAQEAAGAGQAARSAPEEEKVEGRRLPEAEFVMSSSFRSGSLVQPLWREVSFDGHYFGGNENNVGFTGGSWTFHGEHWKIAPCFGVSFGDNGFRTMPALSVRWGYEKNWFISEGLLVQGLLHTKFAPEGTEPEPGQSESKSVVPFIADGNHVSARWKHLTAGGTWEHMQFREGKEWKGGVRVAYKVLPSLSFTFFALGPGSEVRGGVLFQRDEKK
jgi:hypothetical protein